MIRAISLAAVAVALASVCQAATVRVYNTAGSVTVITTPNPQLTVRGKTPDGAAGRNDIAVAREGDDIRVEALPRDVALDLTVVLPLGFALEVTTKDGDIAVEGMVHLAQLETRNGGIRVAAPLDGIRLSLDAVKPPLEFVNPAPNLFRTSETPLAEGQPWRLRDRLEETAIRYGDYSVAAEAPRRVELAGFEPPEGWPLRFHSDASDELLRTLEPMSAQGGSSSSAPLAADGADGDLIFRAQVRMVNLSVAVSDENGNPIPGLDASSFHVEEDGVEQRIGPVQDGDAAFNLAIVLDMSGSAVAYRKPIQDAARRFVEMAREGDQVAIYALTYGMFQVVSPLSSDREALLAAVDRLPGIAGATPLYDIVALAYAQELRQRSGERNALILISDGLDNRLTGGSGPSSVRFGRLERMAKEMSAIVYPVFLVSTDRQERRSRSRSRRSRDAILMNEARGKAWRRMQRLADLSGGRLFPAESIEDLEPVFPLVEAELRSVYTLGYYPSEQALDGSWRTVKVDVDEPDAVVRARPGYFAK